jgi:DNA invertase Pin-like site-specific DNA recombinase
MSDARRRKFDSVAVWRFDRFARSTTHLLAALEEFRCLGIDFISLNESIDTTTPLGKMVFTVCAAVSELERSIIVERVRAGVAKARRDGKRLGRPPGTKVDVKQAVRLRHEGKSLREISNILKVSLGSIHNALRENGGSANAPKNTTSHLENH